MAKSIASCSQFLPTLRTRLLEHPAFFASRAEFRAIIDLGIRARSPYHGCGRGIGRADAEVFAAEGCKWPSSTSRAGAEGAKYSAARGDPRESTSATSAHRARAVRDPRIREGRSVPSTSASTSGDESTQWPLNTSARGLGVQLSLNLTGNSSTPPFSPAARAPLGRIICMASIAVSLLLRTDCILASRWLDRFPGPSRSRRALQHHCKRHRLPASSRPTPSSRRSTTNVKLWRQKKAIRGRVEAIAFGVLRARTLLPPVVP